MDGNRRWARSKNLSTLEGHQQGKEVLFDSVRFFRDQKIPHVIYYAFSTENWKRTEKEVGYLIKLFQKAITEVLERLINSEKPVRIRFVGQRDRFPDSLQQEMTRLEELNEQNAEAKTTIWIALSYGGRTEIIEAVNKAVKKGEEITEEDFKQLLWTHELPDPDIIVRTSGEHRLSNFLTWGSAYSELYFIEKNWPALTTEDFEDILLQYGKRERRKGK